MEKTNIKITNQKNIKIEIEDQIMTSISYFIKMAYDGKNYLGFGVQPHKNTIQNELEKALKLLNKDVKVTTFAMSRTDSKVHALSQYVQFELNINYKPQDLMHKLNRMLPRDITVLTCEYKPDNFNVRFNAIEKTYTYKIINNKNPFLVDYTYFTSEILDLDKMNDTAEFFLGTHDFTAFSGTNTSVKDKVRTVNKISFEKSKFCNEEIIEFKISANGFLYNMVRMIVGTLIKVGMDKVNEEDIKRVLESGNKEAVVFKAPGEGLYLTSVKFGENKKIK